MPVIVGAVGAGQRGVEHGDPAAGRARQCGRHAAQGRDDDAEGVGRARGRYVGVGVAAEDLEDRVAGIGAPRQRRDADLLDDERDAGGGRRTVAPAADRERRIDVGDRRQSVGVVNVASTNRPVLSPSVAVKFLVRR